MIAQACTQDNTQPTQEEEYFSTFPEISTLNAKGQPQDQIKYINEFLKTNQTILPNKNEQNNQQQSKQKQNQVTTPYKLDEKAVYEILEKIKNKSYKQLLKKPFQSVMGIKKYLDQIHEILSDDKKYEKKNKNMGKIEYAKEIKKKGIWDSGFEISSFYAFLGQLESQLDYICELIECQGEIIGSFQGGQNVQEKLGRVNERFHFLKKLQILITEYKHFNFDMFAEINEKLYQFLEDYNIFFYKMLESLKKKKINENQIFEIKTDLVINNSKIESFLQLYPHALVIDQSDLLANKKNSLQLNKFQQRCIQNKSLGSKRFMNALSGQFTKTVSLVNATISRQSTNSYFYLNSVYYFFRHQQAQKDTKYFLTHADETNAFVLWNLLEYGFLKKTLKIILPSIQHHQKIYVPQNYNQLTLKEQSKQIKDGSINKINENPLKPLNNNEKSDIFNKKIVNDNIKIRVLNYKKLHIKKNFDDNNKQFKCECDNCKKNKDKVYKTICIHIHGGGFVAMSSRSQQVITRKLSQKLKVPVFSIDYKLAPQNPYPEGLNDCWQAYNWIVDNIQDYYNIVPEKIILTGESAGGNLAISICGLAIKYNTKVPTSLYPLYPVIDMNLDRYSTSLTLCLDDVVLNHNLLKLCQKAYTKEKDGFQGDPINDPYISPNKLSKEILSKFPTTRILVGSDDPIIDDCIRFCHQLDELGVDSQIQNYQGLPHGFLAFYPIGQMQDFIDEMKKSV